MDPTIAKAIEESILTASKSDFGEVTINFFLDFLITFNNLI